MCCFRHLLEAHDLDTRMFEEVYRHLEAIGLKVAWGTIVDSTIINAPSSTKNAEGDQRRSLAPLTTFTSSTPGPSEYRAECPPDFHRHSQRGSRLHGRLVESRNFSH